MRNRAPTPSQNKLSHLLHEVTPRRQDRQGANIQCDPFIDIKQP